jgi:hypothetical protein
MKKSLLLKKGRKLGAKQGSLLFKQGVVKQTLNNLLKVSLFLKYIITVQSKPSKNQ